MILLLFPKMFCGECMYNSFTKVFRIDGYMNVNIKNIELNCKFGWRINYVDLIKYKILFCEKNNLENSNTG